MKKMNRRNTETRKFRKDVREPCRYFRIFRNSGLPRLLFFLLFAAAPARADNAPKPPTPTAAAAAAAPSEVRDYPDITFWTAWEDKTRQDFQAARAKIQEQLERAKSIGGSGSEVDRLRAVGDELEKSVSQFESIVRYELEKEEFEEARAHLDNAEKSLAEREAAFAAERAGAPPEYAQPDLQRAEDDLLTVTKTRAALNAKVRALPKQIAETRHARERALDEYLQIESTAVDRLTVEGARRERLKLELAYLDSYLEFLPERVSATTRRLEILTRDQKLHEQRLQFIHGVLSGSIARRNALAAQRKDLTLAADQKRKEWAKAPGGTKDAARLAAEVRLLEHRLWLVETGLAAMDDKDRVEQELPLLRRKIVAVQGEAASSDESDPATLAADAEKTRGYVEKFSKDVDEQATHLERMGAEFGKRIAALREEEAGASSGGDAALAAGLAETIAAYERARDETLALETELLKALEDIAAETGKILRIRERARAKAVEKASLFDRRAPKVSTGAFRDAMIMARHDIAMVRAEIAGGALAGRPRLAPVAIVLALALAAFIFFRVRRGIDAALRQSR